MLCRCSDFFRCVILVEKKWGVERLKNEIFVKIFRIFRERELCIFIYKKYILLQREHRGIEYAVICAYFYKKPISWLHNMHKYAVRAANSWPWSKEKSKGFVEKSLGFVKTLRRFVKIILVFFQTKPYLMNENLLPTIF